MNRYSRYRTAALLAFGLAPLAGLFAACADDDPQAPEDGGLEASSSADGTADTSVDPDAAVTDDRAIVLVDATALEVTCEAGPCVVQLAGGGSQICARTATDIAYCWGNNPCGEIPLSPVDAGKADAEAGAAPFVPNTVPAPREILTGVAFVSVGLNAGCAAMTDGSLECWGGLPTSTTPASPARRPHARSTGESPIRNERPKSRWCAAAASRSMPAPGLRRSVAPAGASGQW